MMIRGFFTTFLMKQRLGIFGFGKASLGLGLLLISMNSDLSVFYLYLFYQLGWNATNNGIRFHILCHYCTSSYNCSIADSYSSKNGGIGSNPYVFADVKTMWYRFSRREDDYCIECSSDGEKFSQMRICHMYAGADEFSFGIYACSPEESSFTAVFSDMKITECAWKAHDGQQPDKK